MVRFLPIAKLILILSLVALLVMLLVSACDVSDLFGDRQPDGPADFAILAPDEDTILAGSPVLIQTALPEVDISRVELHVRGPGDETAQLIRSDVPVDSYLLQEFMPQEPGPYMVQVLPYGPQNNVLANNLVRQLQVITSPAVALVEPQPGIAGGEVVATPVIPPTSEIVPLVPTEVVATATAAAGQAGQAGQAAADAEVAVSVAVVEVFPSPTPEPELLYPPPPPAPGVPPGPIESDPDYGPPRCDAAAYEGPFTADTRRRIVISEPDQVPARVVAGSTVFRAWRLRNIGLCTWGPGYELAYYGGRTMGSGGVAFGSTFPAEPVRPNVIVDPGVLIVPEAVPNEVAVLEVMLNVPATPGIHQSYWRMRNPAGIYFGPIIGVTLDVVRECDFGIYGAPVINQFEIIGVGDVYRPADPVSVLAEVGETVTLQYNIINAQSFEIVFEGPTGDLESITTTDPSGRVSFPIRTVGRHVITLYADNGPCLAQAQVFIEALPPEGERFLLDVVISSSSVCAATTAAEAEVSTAVTAGDIRTRWQHFDQEVDQLTLIGQAYRRVYRQECPIVDEIFGWTGHCYMDWTEWEQIGQPVEVVVGQEGAAMGEATISNMERRLVNTACTPGPNTQCSVRYVMRAGKDGAAAFPEFSNAVDVLCSPAAPGLPTEIREAGASGFNPQ